jgi:hypothetical protein
VCVLSSFKWEFTVKYCLRKLGKTVHKVTEAVSCWSMLRKSHLKNFTNVLAVVKTCPKGPEEGKGRWGGLLFLPPYQELIGNSPIGKHEGEAILQINLSAAFAILCPLLGSDPHHVGFLRRLYAWYCLCALVQSNLLSTCMVRGLRMVYY